jgi:hypothetical protein
MDVFMKKSRSIKIYEILGKTICSLAGGLAGYVAGGILLAIPSAILGAICSHFLGKSMTNPDLNN